LRSKEDFSAVALPTESGNTISKECIGKWTDWTYSWYEEADIIVLRVEVPSDQIESLKVFTPV
jgi:hypothetical protein